MLTNVGSRESKRMGWDGEQQGSNEAEEAGWKPQQGQVGSSVQMRGCSHQQGVR